MKNNTNPTQSLGFFSADGFFQPISVLTANSLEFVSKSKLELEDLLQDHLLHERYEKCAIIRDELLKRQQA
ncbi:hypothetical protein HH214_01805 [Mucilaginibacter robiniae]|uniref:UVR domain-containing protein n=1 Tax=Mucilaginibacter robiniae TaxID=2728022 RepID=A0A7L5DZJ0_9SPHI|nr:hypothetical protein [Mucilaginibacter robiniae]QJD94694.1 hypothetical protein HH214_01805 [Mucilaginibacter robiniae]